MSNVRVNGFAKIKSNVAPIFYNEVNVTQIMSSICNLVSHKKKKYLRLVEN